MTEPQPAARHGSGVCFSSAAAKGCASQRPEVGWRGLSVPLVAAAPLLLHRRCTLAPTTLTRCRLSAAAPHIPRPPPSPSFPSH